MTTAAIEKKHKHFTMGAGTTYRHVGFWFPLTGKNAKSFPSYAQHLESQKPSICKGICDNCGTRIVYHHIIEDENGKITYKFEDGRTLNTNNLPKYFVPVPPEHDFVELKEGYTNAPTGEAVLLKFKSGYIVSGMFEKNEDDDGLGYLIWDGDMLDNNPTHYAPMPKLIK